MKLDEQYIKSLPLTTNKINVIFDKDAFFSKYSIVSYFSTNDLKNLAYEQLADVPCISVTGVRARWTGLRFPSVHFFILAIKGEETNILNSLRDYDYIRSQIDTLEEYDEMLQKRIIASLAINSLGKKKNNNRMMYNDGSLLICDDKNFNMPKSRQELVCLKIEVNEYMNLIARTTSFSNPSSLMELKRRKNCVFGVSNDIGGPLWEGRSVKPIVIKDFKDGDYNLKELYILKKRFSDNKNNVPYWPYNKENYTHGKLFVIWQVVNSVNEDFKDIVEIDFCDFQVLHYDECRTGDDMLSFMREYFSGKTIYINDPFDTNASKELIFQFKAEAQSLMGDCLIFSQKPSSNDMVIKLCEPKDLSADRTHYTQSLYRLAHSCNALQHITVDENKKNEITKASARRILIELLVKDSLINRIMPKQLAELMCGWVFYRYKINKDIVHGASLAVGTDGSMNINEYGLSQNNLGEDFEQFVLEYLKFNDYDKIRGARDYMALEKNGNVYLIIDTDEIPILDVNLIDDGYDQVINKGETVAMFKRKKNVHEYLRGYIGFHLWKSDGLNGEKDAAYSYIAGTNSENMQIMQSTKMDKMPRARRIFVLNEDNPDTVSSDINEITTMLKFGFGRWNELMTYPFPFKFLQEYLDDACETVFSKHWKEITYRGEL